MDWQDIKTAPKDGTQILLASIDDETGAFGIRHGFYEKATNDQCWYDIDGETVWEPSYWCQITPPPGGRL